MKTKQEQLAALAEFVKLENTVINPCEFDPYGDWNHLKLVLEALAKHEQQRLSVIHGPQSWGNMGWDHVLYCLKSRAFHKWNEPFDLASAVNSMALEVIATNTKGK